MQVLFSLVSPEAISFVGTMEVTFELVAPLDGRKWISVEGK